MKEQLEEFLEKHNLLTKCQYGGKKGLSTVKAVDSIVSYVIDCFENKKSVAATLLDQCKAYDIVPYPLLMYKFWWYKVRGLQLSLVESYFFDRFQMVKCGKFVSELLQLIMGVQQGSVFGNFCYTVYINDFPNYLMAYCVMFIDDVTYLTSSKDLKILAQLNEENSQRAMCWFDENQLVINQDKTDSIVFSLASNGIEHKSVKLLGMHLDSKLTWNHHTDKLCSRLARVTYLLRKLKACTNINLLMNAYFAFFHSHLLYGVTLWGNSSSAKKVFIWQKKAVRILKGANVCDPCREIFIEFNIMTLPSVFIYYSLLYVKENLQMYQLRKNTHKHDTRNKNLIDIDFVRLSKTKNNYKVCGVTFFNALPSEARLVSSKRFKLVLHEWLCKKAFYTVDEFLQTDMDIRF